MVKKENIAQVNQVYHNNYIICDCSLPSINANCARVTFIPNYLETHFNAPNLVGI